MNVSVVSTPDSPPAERSALFKRIGELLLEQSGLSVAQLEQGLATQTKTGERLGEILVKQKAITEWELLVALGSQFGVEVAESLPGQLNTEFTAHLPIGFLKSHLMIPLITEERIAIAATDPTSFEPLDEVRHRLKMGMCPMVLSSRQEIIRAINNAYDMSSMNNADEVMQDIDEEDPDVLFSRIEEVGDLLDDTSDSPVIRLVNLMLSQAVRNNVSDIHIEPYQNSLKIRQRLDGVLYDMFSPPFHVAAALTSRVKLMAKMNIAEKRLPQDGRIEIKVGNKDIDIRVSTLPTSFGERVVMRLLDKSSVRMSLTDLGMSDDRLELFSRIIEAPNGIVLVTGPTGSGKTTTLYAALSAINHVGINIITVEDPIEYRIPGIAQVQVNPKIDLSFASGLRSIVRQDPDVILIGEIRDLETAEIAIQSALTGHLVFSTLHTNDAPSSITRLRDMGVEPFLIASAINAILAQRLVRIICDQCREPYSPSPTELVRVGLDKHTIDHQPVYRGRGCEACNHTGYRGRTGIHEFLIMDEAMKNLVLTTSGASKLRELARERGMLTLVENGADKILAGITSIEEVYRVAHG
jgi:general secretion pathway protein E